MSPLMTLDQFYAKWIGQKNVANVAGTYPGECVSFGSRYFLDRFGIRTGAWGNAVDYWYKTNALILAQFIKFGPETPIHDGDVLLWEDDEGSFTGAAGHMAVAYHEQLLNSNNNGVKRVTLNPMFRQGYVGLLRPKGGDDMADKTLLTKLWAGYADQFPAPDSYLAFWDGKPTTEVLDWLIAQDIHKEMSRKSRDYDRVVDIAEDRLKSIKSLQAQAPQPAIDVVAIEAAITALQQVIGIK